LALTWFIKYIFFWFSCFHRLRLFSLQIFWLWVYLMKVIPEMHCVHSIWYLHFYYPLANEVAKGYTVVTLPAFRNILVNTLESTSFNGFWPNLVHT
jgi:hypothetical protein